MSELRDLIEFVGKSLVDMPEKVEAAFKIVLKALAVRPCFPITLPRSVSSTISSITTVCSPSISLTSHFVLILY